MEKDFRKSLDAQFRLALERFCASIKDKYQFEVEFDKNFNVKTVSKSPINKQHQQSIIKDTNIKSAFDILLMKKNNKASYVTKRSENQKVIKPTSIKPTSTIKKTTSSVKRKLPILSFIEARTPTYQCRVYENNYLTLEHGNNVFLLDKKTKYVFGKLIDGTVMYELSEEDQDIVQEDLKLKIKFNDV